MAIRFPAGPHLVRGDFRPDSTSRYLRLVRPLRCLYAAGRRTGLFGDLGRRAHPEIQPAPQLTTAVAGKGPSPGYPSQSEPSNTRPASQLRNLVRLPASH